MNGDLEELDSFVLKVKGATNWLARKLALIMMIIGVVCIIYWLLSI